MSLQMKIYGLCKVIAHYAPHEIVSTGDFRERANNKHKIAELPHHDMLANVLPINANQCIDFALGNE